MSDQQQTVAPAESPRHSRRRWVILIGALIVTGSAPAAYVVHLTTRGAEPRLAAAASLEPAERVLDVEFVEPDAGPSVDPEIRVPFGPSPSTTTDRVPEATPAPRTSPARTYVRPVVRPVVKPSATASRPTRTGAPVASPPPLPTVTAPPMTEPVCRHARKPWHRHCVGHPRVGGRYGNSV